MSHLKRASTFTALFAGTALMAACEKAPEEVVCSDEGMVAETAHDTKIDMSVHPHFHGTDFHPPADVIYNGPHNIAANDPVVPDWADVEQAAFEQRHSYDMEEMQPVPMRREPAAIKDDPFIKMLQGEGIDEPFKSIFQNASIAASVKLDLGEQTQTKNITINLDLNYLNCQAIGDELDSFSGQIKKIYALRSNPAAAAQFEMLDVLVTEGSLSAVWETTNEDLREVMPANALELVEALPDARMNVSMTCAPGGVQ